MRLPSITNKSILPRHRLRRNNTLTPRHETPPARTEGAIENASVFDLRQVEDSIGLDLDLVWVRLRQQDIGRFFGERLGRQAVEGSRPIDSLFGWAIKLEGFVR